MFIRNCISFIVYPLSTSHGMRNELLLLEIEYLIAQRITTMRSTTTIGIKILESVLNMSCSNTLTASPSHINKTLNSDLTLFLHSAWNAASRCRMSVATDDACLVALPNWSHKCLIGFRYYQIIAHGCVVDINRQSYIIVGNRELGNRIDIKKCNRSAISDDKWCAMTTRNTIPYHYAPTTTSIRLPNKTISFTLSTPFTDRAITA